MTVSVLPDAPAITGAAGPEPSIDVAICTRNRQPLLAQTLDAVRRAAEGRPAVRILVVDNGSTDGTAAYLAEQAAADPRIVHRSEPQAGIYHARATAVRTSTADWLVFIDDDVIPRPDFLARFADLFADPTVGAVGASISGLFHGPLPDWFPRRFLSSIPLLPVSLPIEECAFPNYPPGACLAVRRVPCLDYYLVPQRREAELGYGGGAISGQPMTGGEDTDLCEIYVRAGFRVIRSSGVCVQHRVEVHRLTEAWIIGKFAIDGRTRIRVARLFGRPLFARYTLAMLAALPVLTLLAPVAPLAGRHTGLLVRAYHVKSLAAWRELLSGRKDLRLPFPPPGGPAA